MNWFEHDKYKHELPLVVLGGGGHAKVLIDALQKQGSELLGVVDPLLKVGEKSGPLAVPVLGGDEALEAYSTGRLRLINGVGSLPGDTGRRRWLFEDFKAQGYRFDPVIHPTAIIGAGVILEEGVQVMAGAVIQSGCRIGANSIINTGAIVDHDCDIARHVHIAPGATLSGGVSLGDDAHIGTGASVIQGIRVGERAIVAAGAIVVRDVEPDCTVRMPMSATQQG